MHKLEMKKGDQPFLRFDRGRRGRTPSPVPVAEGLVAAEVWEEVSGEESRDHGTVVAVGLVAHPLTAPTRMASQVYFIKFEIYPLIWAKS